MGKVKKIKAQAKLWFSYKKTCNPSMDSVDDSKSFFATSRQFKKSKTALGFF